MRTLFSEIVENVSLFLSGMLLGVALGIIATLIGVTAYMNRDKE
ncbi:hypothetical protein SEA_BELFORT_68 [Streptomyces phage Belfort]|uniref:Uncharacterized protein n=1 Tax=Streptomyces phage Belfort TaxID=2801887 RepID=A0A7T8C1S5_9CAUD|nr:hypothetical protein SEA_BELFORT_68 [Streptomyces phage Belfort]